MTPTLHLHGHSRRGMLRFIFNSAFKVKSGRNGRMAGGLVELAGVGGGAS